MLKGGFVDVPKNIKNLNTNIIQCFIWKGWIKAENLKVWIWIWTHRCNSQSRRWSRCPESLLLHHCWMNEPLYLHRVEEAWLQRLNSVWANPEFEVCCPASWWWSGHLNRVCSGVRLYSTFEPETGWTQPRCLTLLPKRYNTTRACGGQQWA